MWFCIHLQYCDTQYIHMRKITHCPALAKHNALFQADNWGMFTKGNHLKTQEPEASSKGQQVKVTGEFLTLLAKFVPGWGLTVAFRWPLHPILNENGLRWKHICIACQKPTMGWHVAQAKLSGSMIHCVGILCSELTEKYATTEGHYTNTTDFFFFSQGAGPPPKCEKSAPLTDVRKSSVTKPNSCIKHDVMQDLMLPNKN